MPNNILITPGSASIQFSGSAANTIRLQVESSGSIAFYGNSGSLFGISDQLSGSLMSVNDISGLPILEVFSDDRVVMGSFNKNTLVVTGSRIGIGKAIPTTNLDISGSVFVTGSLQMSDGGITGSLLGTSSVATSASFATTASAATSITFIPTTASFAVSASWAPGGTSGLTTKAGSIANTAFAGNPRKAPVNFSTPFGNTNYAIVITGEDARSWTYEGKVVGGFTASANSNTTLAGTTTWIATAYGET